LVSLRDLEFGELGRALVAAALALAATAAVTRFLPGVSTHPKDVLTIAAGSVVWAGSAAAVLAAMGSKLPRQILRRR
jgi:hypothetical protein